MNVTTYEEEVVTIGSGRNIAVNPNATNSFTPRSGITVPTSVTEDELFYWSRKWQADQAESSAELACGDYLEFETAKDAIRWLLDPSAE